MRLFKCFSPILLLALFMVVPVQADDTDTSSQETQKPKSGGFFDKLKSSFRTGGDSNTNSEGDDTIDESEDDAVPSEEGNNLQAQADPGPSSVPVNPGNQSVNQSNSTPTPPANSANQGASQASQTPPPSPPPVQSFPPAKFKKTISVMNFDSQVVENKFHSRTNLGTGMRAQLVDALIHSEQFIVLERENIRGVMAEQDFAAGGRTTVSKTAQIGKIIPSQIVVKGTVTEYEQRASGESDSGSLNIGALFGVPYVPSVGGGQQSSEAHVGLIVRIIDASSGQVIDSQRVGRTILSESDNINLAMRGISFGHKDFKKTPMGKAVHFTIQDAVRKINQRLSKVPFVARVIKAKGGKIYFNAGKRNNVKVGDTFTVSNLDEALIDPITGENLGGEKTKVGSITVTKAQEKFSIATSEIADQVNPGDEVSE